MEKYLQLTLKNGIHVQIVLSNSADYKKIRNRILKSEDEFITIIDSCTVRTADISLIELLHYDKEDNKIEN